jgi:hypothetical protein
MVDSLVCPLVASLEVLLVVLSDSSSGHWLEQPVQESHGVPALVLKSENSLEHWLDCESGGLWEAGSDCWLEAW